MEAIDLDTTLLGFKYKNDYFKDTMKKHLSNPVRFNQRCMYLCETF